jgi:hypothetical protein
VAFQSLPGRPLQKEEEALLDAAGTDDLDEMSV